MFTFYSRPHLFQTSNLLALFCFSNPLLIITTFCSVPDSRVSFFLGEIPLNLLVVSLSKGILMAVLEANINHGKDHGVKS